MRTSIQGVSTRCVAIPAENSKVGDYRLWNGGSRTKLISIKPKGNTQLVLTYEGGVDGKDDVRILGRKTPVAMMADATTRNLLTIVERPTPTV